jgi:hypothetical protein
MHRVIKLAAVTMFMLACASSPIDVTGSFDPPYITQPFVATSGMFDTVVAPTRLGGSDRITFTELYFTNGSDACGEWARGATSLPFLAVQAAIYTSTPESPIDGAVDVSVHGPGVFPLSPALSNDGRADASWEFSGTNTVEDNFTGGAIRVTAVSDDLLSGMIVLQTSDPQLAPSSGFANGSFTIPRCTAPYVTAE